MRISIWSVVIAVICLNSAEIWAVDAALVQDHQLIEKDERMLRLDNQLLEANKRDTHELDRQRNIALQTKNPNTAMSLQSTIDKKKAERTKIEAEINKLQAELEREKHKASADCADDKTCEEKRQRYELTHALEGAKRALASDEAAAGRVQQDKANVEKLENELNALSSR